MITSQRGRGAPGFTLVELMIAVVIVGVLSAVAVPAFSRYVRRAKTAEATNNIAKIHQGEVAYYLQAPEVDGSTTRFIIAIPVDFDPSASKFPANPTRFTDDPFWSAIGFSLDVPHYYRYEVNKGPTDTIVTSFWAEAYGDLDGDDVDSHFKRGGVLVDGEIQSTALVVEDELE